MKRLGLASGLALALGFAFVPQGCGGAPSGGAAAYGGAEVPESIARQLRACAAEHTDHLRSAEYSVSFDLKLGSDGRVDELSLRDSTLNDEGLEACMAHALRALTVDDLPIRLSQSRSGGFVAPESRAAVGQAEIFVAACLADPPCAIALMLLMGTSAIGVTLFVDATLAHKSPRAGPRFPVPSTAEPETKPEAKPAGEPKPKGELHTEGPSPPVELPPREPKDKRETCREMLPWLIRCDDPTISHYRFQGEDEVFKEIARKLGKGLRKSAREDEAERGPCVDRGGFHTNVLRGGRSVISIVGCDCCDDWSGKAVKKQRADVR